MSAFSQLLRLVPRDEFDRLVRSLVKGRNDNLVGADVADERRPGGGGQPIRLCCRLRAEQAAGHAPRGPLICPPSLGPKEEGKQEG